MKKLSFLSIACLLFATTQTQTAPQRTEKQESSLNLTINSSAIESISKSHSQLADKIKELQNFKNKIVKNYSVAQKTRKSMSQSSDQLIEKYKNDAEEALNRINNNLVEIETKIKELLSLADKAATESSCDVQTLHDDNDQVIARLQDQQAFINSAAQAAAAAAKA